MTEQSTTEAEVRALLREAERPSDPWEPPPCHLCERVPEGGALKHLLAEHPETWDESSDETGGCE